MKYQITHLNCAKASRSWIVDIECRFPTRTQSTWMSKQWTSDGLDMGHNLIVAIIKTWLLVRKEINNIQAEPGSFKLA